MFPNTPITSQYANIEGSPIPNSQHWSGQKFTCCTSKTNKSMLNQNLHYNIHQPTNVLFILGSLH